MLPTVTVTVAAVSGIAHDAPEPNIPTAVTPTTPYRLAMAVLRVAQRTNQRAIGSGRRRRYHGEPDSVPSRSLSCDCAARISSWISR